jgi:TIR domain
MSDIFISYSHKDTDVVRDMVPSLKAEGFTVWWDHTIPPGKTWDDVIARGIREAKACIIVWSASSVVSDWVKEEATIAKEGGKYLPVQFGPDLPPLGFRRIQSADLRNWNGNPQDPQWRMLITEISNLVGAKESVEPLPAPPPVPVPVTIVKPVERTPETIPAPPHPKPVAGNRGLLIGLAVGAVVVIVGFLALRRPAAASPAGGASVLGVWKGWYHLDVDPPGQRTPFVGTFQADGTMIGQSGGNVSGWRWTQSGSSVQWTNGTVTDYATLAGNQMSGSISWPQHTGNFEATR